MNELVNPTAEQYRQAFEALERSMTDTRRKLLEVHHEFPNHQATMTQIAEAMGRRRYGSGNLHYGKLAKLVAEKLGNPYKDCWHIKTLCTFIEPEQYGDHLLLTLRPQVVEALEMLGWVRPAPRDNRLLPSIAGPSNE